MIREFLENMSEDPRERLTRLFKYTNEVVWGLIKHFIKDDRECGYQDAMTVL